MNRAQYVRYVHPFYPFKLLVRPIDLTIGIDSELLNRNELNVLLDERMSEQEKAELVQCENICRRFLEWDLIGLVTNGAYEEVRPLLRKVVGSN